MDHVIIPENHYSLCVSNNIEEIISPLKKYGIAHFLYAKSYNDRTLYALTNNTCLYKHHFDCGYNLGPLISTENKTLNLRFFALPNSDDVYNQALHDYRQYFKLENFIFFVDRYDTYSEMFIFAGKINDNKILNFYLNESDILKLFKFYFFEKAKDLIIKSEKNKIIIPEKLYVDYLDLKKNQETRSSTQTNQIIIAKNYRINYAGRSISFSQKEIDCINLLKKGHTTKEIAKIISKSPRTIEDRINIIKDKFNIRNKSLLVNTILNTFDF